MRTDISSESTEYVRVRVQAMENGSFVDPSDFPVEMAVTTTEDAHPEEDEWRTAEWEAISTAFYARIVVGPGVDYPLTAGRIYKVWVRIHADNETIVGGVGWLTPY